MQDAEYQGMKRQRDELQAIVDTLPLDGNGKPLTPGCERMQDGKLVVVETLYSGIDSVLVGEPPGTGNDDLWEVMPEELTEVMPAKLESRPDA